MPNIARRCWCWLLIWAASAAASAAAPPTTAPAPGRLAVAGKELTYRGKPVVLRGVAVGDPTMARVDRPLSDYRRVAERWNANVTRISVHPAVWKAGPHAKVLDRLKREIDAAVDAGMFVVIDWHVIGWPGGYFERPKPEWGLPADLYDSNLDLAADFWGAVAEKFGGDGRVAFELWNEPVHDDGGDPPAPPRWRHLKPHWEKLTAVIRAHSANLVLAAGEGWAYDLRRVKGDLLKDDNTAYTWHVYAGHDENKPEVWAEHLDDLQTVRPVVVTEWGFEPNSREHYGGTVTQFGEPFTKEFLDGRSLHSTAWCWHPEWGPAMLKRDWETPTAFGEFVKRYLTEHKRELVRP